MKKEIKNIIMAVTVATMLLFSASVFAVNNYSIYGDTIFTDTENTENKTK